MVSFCIPPRQIGGHDGIKKRPIIPEYQGRKVLLPRCHPGYRLFDAVTSLRYGAELRDTVPAVTVGVRSNLLALGAAWLPALQLSVESSGMFFRLRLPAGLTPSPAR
jgi:hypothetical protein